MLWFMHEYSKKTLPNFGTHLERLSIGYKAVFLFSRSVAKRIIFVNTQAEQ